MITLVTSDIKNIIGEDLLESGIDKNVFESVNNMKKTLLEKIASNQA